MARRVFPESIDPLVIYIDRLFGVAELLKARAWRRSRARLKLQGWEGPDHASELASIQAFINRGMAKARGMKG